MKHILSLLVLLVLLAGTACSKKVAVEEQQSQTKAASEQLAYICPMRCAGSASPTPGKCPVCHMDLEKNPDYQAAAADSTAHPVH